MCLDLLLQFGNLPLGDRDRVGAGHEATRRPLQGRDGQQGLRELGRVAGLLAVARVPPLPLLGPALGVVIDRRGGVGGGLVG